MTEPRMHVDHPVLRNIPLPGLFQCLSWQLNVTTYPKQGHIKMVSVIREPSDQVEVCREFLNPTMISTLPSGGVENFIRQGWVDLEYLSGWRND